MLFDQALVSERVSYWGRADVSLSVGVIIGIVVWYGKGDIHFRTNRHSLSGYMFHF